MTDAQRQIHVDYLISKRDLIKEQIAQLDFLIETLPETLSDDIDEQLLLPAPGGEQP